MASKHRSQYSTGVMYGLINGVMLIPIAISFCTIIYRDKAFESYLPQLVKLVLFSSLVHQLAFSYFSSLPFAIGQVQDAGLIFLSAMAGSIVENCKDKSQIVPTTLVVLSICTFLLGGMLLIVSKLKLATVIQYLPMPVIGGYLAFIGFFCGQAGLAMMAGVQVATILDWGNFLTPHAAILMAPGVLLGTVMYIVLCKLRSPYVLPCSMLLILIIFYSCMLLYGATLEDARAFGWVAPLSLPGPFYSSWLLYDFTNVDWTQLPQQFFRLIGMFLVVAFSSSLDVAAIEMELGLPLDYNKELHTVGISNVFSGLFGGYTGSYIFSQTIFTMRRGVYSRICGYTVVVCEAVMILLPISIMSYLPKMFFGALLTLIAVDLMVEWLIEARKKMTEIEYGVCLLTFVAIQVSGIEIGMLSGVMFSMMSFVYSYSQLQTVSIASLKSSTVIRTFEERAALIANRGKVVTISLKGYVFFGSAVKILEDVKSHVSISVPHQTLDGSSHISNNNNNSSDDDKNRQQLQLDNGSTNKDTLVCCTDDHSNKDIGSKGYSTFEDKNGTNKDDSNSNKSHTNSATKINYRMTPMTARSVSMRRQQQQQQLQYCLSDDNNNSSYCNDSISNGVNSANRIRTKSGNAVDNSSTTTTTSLWPTSLWKQQDGYSQIPSNNNDTDTEVGSSTNDIYSSYQNDNNSTDVNSHSSSSGPSFRAAVLHMFSLDLGTSNNNRKGSTTTTNAANAAAAARGSNSPFSDDEDLHSTGSRKQPLMRHQSLDHRFIMNKSREQSPIRGSSGIIASKNDFHNIHHHHLSNSNSIGNEDSMSSSPVYSQLLSVYDMSSSDMRRHLEQRTKELNDRGDIANVLRSSSYAGSMLLSPPPPPSSPTKQLHPSHAINKLYNDYNDDDDVEVGGGGGASLYHSISSSSNCNNSSRSTSKDNEKEDVELVTLPSEAIRLPKSSTVKRQPTLSTVGEEDDTVAVGVNSRRGGSWLTENSPIFNTTPVAEDVVSNSSSSNNNMQHKITTPKLLQRANTITVGNSVPYVTKADLAAAVASSTTAISSKQKKGKTLGDNTVASSSCSGNRNATATHSYSTEDLQAAAAVAATSYDENTINTASASGYDISSPRPHTTSFDSICSGSSTGTGSASAAATTPVVNDGQSTSSLLAAVWTHQANRRSNIKKKKADLILMNTKQQHRSSSAPDLLLLAAGNAPTTPSTNNSSVAITSSSSNSSPISQNLLQQRKIVGKELVVASDTSISPALLRQECNDQVVPLASNMSSSAATSNTATTDLEEQCQAIAALATNTAHSTSMHHLPPDEIMTEYLVLDFTAVIGVDATAARSCFLMLVQLMRSAKVVVVFANMSESVESLFRAHKVIGELDIVIPQLDDALEWCEEQVLYRASQYDPSIRGGKQQQQHTVSSLGVGSGDSLDDSSSDNYYEEEDRLMQQYRDCTTPTATAGKSGMSYDPSYYSRAWKQRQQIAKAKKTRQQLKQYHQQLLGSNNEDPNVIQPPSTTTTMLYGPQTFPPTSHLHNHIAAAVSRPSSLPVVQQLNPTSARMLRRILEDYLEIDSSSDARLKELLRSELLIQYFSKMIVADEEVVFDIDEDADKIYFIERGEVEIVTISPIFLEQQRQLHQMEHDGGPLSLSSVSSSSGVGNKSPRLRRPSFGGGSAAAGIATSGAASVHSNSSNSHNITNNNSEPNVVRVNKVSGGGAFGESDFFLGKKHSVQAYTLAPSVFWTLDRENYARMEVRHPTLCLLIQHSLLKSLAISSTCAMYALYPTTAYSSEL